MPEVTPETFGLVDKSPAELEERRRQIVAKIAAAPGGYDDPDIPIEILQELSLVTGMLRRKTAGPPKAAKPTKRGNGPKLSSDDLMNLIG